MENLFSTMCVERMSCIEIKLLFFLPWGDQYFIVQSVLLCQSNSFLMAPPHFCVTLCTHWYTLLASYPYAHSSKIYLTPQWPTLSIYFDLFAHLILVPLSCSILCFKLFASGYSLLLPVLCSLSDSYTLFFFLSSLGSSWRLRHTVSVFSIFYLQHCVISFSHSEKL